MADVIYVLIIWVSHSSNHYPNNLAVVGSFSTPAACEATLINWRRADRFRHYGVCIEADPTLELK